MFAVRATGLTKAFESRTALKGVDLEVRAGEIRGLLGPNGAGKTTLLRVLFGLVWPDAGSVELFDRKVDGRDPAALDGVGGFVEEPAFYPYLSGRANLELLAELDRGRRPGRVSDALEAVGLADRAEDRCNGYSTGMRQRLGIAAALLRAPRLLLLDEPTSGLDPAGVRDISALVADLSAQGTTILLSSHLISQLEQLCDNFTFIREGQVVWSGSADQLTEAAPASAYLLATSDNERVLELADSHAGVRAARADGKALRLEVETGRLDPFVIALGVSGIAVRRLEMLMSPLASMFLALTAEAEGAGGKQADGTEYAAGVQRGQPVGLRGPEA
jgi:ABC-2 type transport system ATP-binding protein